MVTQVGIHKFQATARETQVSAKAEAGAEKQAPDKDTSAAARPISHGEVLATPIPALDADALESAVQHIAEAAQVRQRSLEFTVDEESGRTIITVIDKETDEIIRQIPPEEVVALQDFFRQSSGLLVNTEA